LAKDYAGVLASEYPVEWDWLNRLAFRLFHKPEDWRVRGLVEGEAGIRFMVGRFADRGDPLMAWLDCRLEQCPELEPALSDAVRISGLLHRRFLDEMGPTGRVSFIGSAPRRRESPVEEESTQRIVD
jgi:hypothetical protein